MRKIWSSPKSGIKQESIAIINGKQLLLISKGKTMLV
jgi:hypothetical protein